MPTYLNVFHRVSDPILTLKNYRTTNSVAIVDINQGS
jgi:hypothetical protein